MWRSQAKAPGRDVILDFTHSEGDRIVLRKIDADVSAPVDDGFEFIGTGAFTEAGQLQDVVVPGQALLHGDVTGEGRSDFEIEQRSVTSLVAEDFAL